eukprot:scaffold1744_cov340-Prasinococcus_capsulatus_cf.AAC.7
MEASAEYDDEPPPPTLLATSLQSTSRGNCCSELGLFVPGSSEQRHGHVAFKLQLVARAWWAPSGGQGFLSRPSLQSRGASTRKVAIEPVEVHARATQLRDRGAGAVQEK